MGTNTEFGSSALLRDGPEVMGPQEPIRGSGEHERMRYVKVHNLRRARHLSSNGARLGIQDQEFCFI